MLEKHTHTYFNILIYVYNINETKKFASSVQGTLWFMAPVGIGCRSSPHLQK